MQEPAGFRDFVTDRSPALLRFAWLLTGDHHLAEDLLATALAKTWPRWERLSDPASAEGYVRRILVTTRVNWWRRRWRSEIPTEALPDRLTTDDAADLAVRHDVAVALASLSRGQRAVVVLRYYADLSEQQIASELGCSVGTVESQHAKAIARLRTQLPLLRDDTEEATR